MRRAVVPVTYVEEWVVQRRQIAGEQQRGDPSLVGLEREGDDVAHQPRVIAEIFGQPVLRAFHAEDRGAHGLRPVVRPVLHLSHAFDPAFEFPHAGQILIQPGSVGRADRPAQTLRAIRDAVENAPIPQAAAVLEQAVEGERRVHLVGHG